MGDHGESLGEHGEATHGFFIYQSTMHVPLIIRAPYSLMHGRRVADVGAQHRRAADRRSSCSA